MKKNVNGLFHHKDISKELCEACLKEKQKASIFCISVKKITKFLNRIHVNIDEDFSIIFRDNKYFLLIKNDTIDIFFVYLMKTKDKILKQVQIFERAIKF